MSTEKELLKTPKFTVVQRDSNSGTCCFIRHPGAVVILPFVSEGKLCMIYNRRKTVDERLLELPAGTLEPGESPPETAIRELSEETGYFARCINPLITYYVSPGILNEQMHSFVATDLVLGETNLMADEEIEPLVVDFSDAIQWIHEGRIRDAKSITTLLYYSQFHVERLQAK